MIKDAFEALARAERPVLVFGAGARGAVELARELAFLTGIPVAPTWGARDLFPADGGNVLCVGGFGTHGTRAANFAVQNADWILSVGSRLDSKATGTPRKYFARAARIFMVDIDPAEIAKFRNELGASFMGAQADAALFLRDAVEMAGRAVLPDITEWRARCHYWLERYPAGGPPSQGADVCPYELVRALSRVCQPGEVIVSDTGLSLAWLMQAFAFKAGQTFVHALNQTPMGYGLPAAIGAAFARPGQRVVLVSGDGGFMLNLQELPLLARHKLPVKIILVNNGGHAMCRQTQEQWLGGKYYSTSLEGGLSMPDFCDVAEACGVAALRVSLALDLEHVLSAAFGDPHAALVEVVVDGGRRLIPQVPYGTPNEDGSPRLSREELRREMIVGLVDD